MYMYMHFMYTIHALQISEMYSSGGELHIELMTGQPQGSKSLWVSGSTHCMSIRLCATYTCTCSYATHYTYAMMLYECLYALSSL